MLQLPESDVAEPGLLACLSETRIGPLDLFGSTCTEPLGFVTGSSHRASIDSCREVTTDLDLYTQPDPVGLQNGSNLYAYSEGKPISNYDPLGLSTHRASACGSRFISYLGGVNHLPWVGDYLDKKIGNNLLGYCARCQPPETPSGAHVIPPPPLVGGTPVVSQPLPNVEVPGIDTIRGQCGPCNGSGEKLYVVNVKTLSARTPGELNDKKLFYSLEYQCDDCHPQR